MIVHFGLHLDGMQSAPPATAVGEIALGPARLVDLLELQLGLPPVPIRPGEALLAYETCLAEIDHETRFYHRSFAVDSMGVARTLLGWRSEWYEAGWQGRFDAEVSRRMADMAAIEQLAKDRVPLCAGQRLQHVRLALQQGLRTQIVRVVLHEVPAALPAAWRDVLLHFDCETAPGIEPVARAAPGTDLRRVQEALLGLADHEAGAPPDAIALAADRSFVVVRGVSRDLSAQALGEFLRQTGAPQDTVLIAESDGIIVDNALERVGLPRAGFQHYSRFRAVTQVLKLCLGLVWEPISTHLLLQFLLHPVGPLPGAVRSMLAEAVASQPGIGGQAWRAAIERIAARETRRAATEAGTAGPQTRAGAAAAGPPAPAAGTQADLFADDARGPSADPSDISPESAARIRDLLEDIRYWLEPERYPPKGGAPVEVLIERAQRCTTWLARRLHRAGGSETDLYAAAQAQGEALIDALTTLKDRGDTHVERIALEQLVDEVTGNSSDPGTFAEAGHVRATTDPAAITQPWRTVIWWDLTAQSLRAGYPWSEAELDELRKHGVQLPPPDERIRARSRAWQRPILNAAGQLILVVHDREEGHHPLWSQLASIVQNYNEIRIEDELLVAAGAASRKIIPALEIATEPLVLNPLPAKRRWWKLPVGSRLTSRDTESYSSLQKLIYSPHEWVLSYPARLATGRAANLATGPLLYGNLAHRLFQSYFETFPTGGQPNWAGHEEATVRSWLAHALPQLIEREGAVLVEAGMGVEREQVATTIENALLQLLKALKQAGIVSVEAEKWHEVPFRSVLKDAAEGTRRTRNIALRGAIDLLLTDRRGREIVLDVKWGSQDWRGKELAENRALQLAAYAFMRHQTLASSDAQGSAAAATGSADPWPAQAYFIVTTGNIVASDTQVFPEAIPFPPIDGESVEQVWDRLGASFDWRWTQLAAGEIEVNAAGTEADERSVAPAGALAGLAPPSRFDEYTWLTGWEHGE